MEDASDYERLRQENIARNEAKLRSLGLGTDTRTGAARRGPKTETRKLPPAEPTRRSSRRRKAVASYREEDIEAERRRKSEEESDYEGEELEEQRAADFEERRRQDFQAMIDAQRGWQKAHLEEVTRAREAARSAKASRSPVSVADAAKQEAAKAEAVERWGSMVAQQPIEDWCRYLSSRTTSPPPLSPFALLQEHYAHDGWKLLCACIMMSRVSSAATKERCITEFFELWPTPTAFLLADPTDVEPVLHSLGLFPQRYGGLIDLTARWVQMPDFRVGLDKELKIKQVGPFGVDSYNLFAKGLFDEEPGDRNLKAFWRWRRATAAEGAEA